MGAKDWYLQGEVDAVRRPLNSALEVGQRELYHGVAVVMMVLWQQTLGDFCLDLPSQGCECCLSLWLCVVGDHVCMWSICDVLLG